MTSEETMVTQKTARKEFGEITQSFNTLCSKGSTLEEMCRHFDGRLDPIFEQFDFDYKHLTATIFMQDGKPVLSSSAEVWEDNGCSVRAMRIVL